MKVNDYFTGEKLIETLHHLGIEATVERLSPAYDLVRWEYQERKFQEVVYALDKGLKDARVYVNRLGILECVLESVIMVHREEGIHPFDAHEGRVTEAGLKWSECEAYTRESVDAYEEYRDAMDRWIDEVTKERPCEC